MANIFINLMVNVSYLLKFYSVSKDHQNVFQQGAIIIILTIIISISTERVVKKMLLLKVCGTF